MDSYYAYIPVFPTHYRRTLIFSVSTKPKSVLGAEDILTKWTKDTEEDFSLHEGSVVTFDNVLPFRIDFSL